MLNVMLSDPYLFLYIFPWVFIALTYIIMLRVNQFLIKLKVGHYV